MIIILVLTSGWNSSDHRWHFPLSLVHKSDEDVFAICWHHHREGCVLSAVSSPVVYGLLVANRGQHQLVLHSWADTGLILIKLKVLDL